MLDVPVRGVVETALARLKERARGNSRSLGAESRSSSSKRRDRST
jgi:hypothetical protein